MRGAQGKRCDLAQVRRRPVVFAFVSMHIDTPPSCGSLAGNQLCGLDSCGRVINKLCEGLKGSAVTSLKCATPERSPVSAH